MSGKYIDHWSRILTHDKQCFYTVLHKDLERTRLFLKQVALYNLVTQVVLKNQFFAIIPLLIYQLGKVKYYYDPCRVRKVE